MAGKIFNCQLICFDIVAKRGLWITFRDAETQKKWRKLLIHRSTERKLQKSPPLSPWRRILVLDK